MFQTYTYIATIIQSITHAIRRLAEIFYPCLSKPMREDVSYAMSSFIGQNLVKSHVEKSPKSWQMEVMWLLHPFYPLWLNVEFALFQPKFFIWWVIRMVMQII